MCKWDVNVAEVGARSHLLGHGEGSGCGSNVTELHQQEPKAIFFGLLCGNRPQGSRVVGRYGMKHP